MIGHEIGHCNSVNDLLDGVHALCEGHNVTGIVVVLSYQSGDCMTTHQYGIGDAEFAVAAQLIADYAKGKVYDCTVN